MTADEGTPVTRRALDLLATFDSRSRRLTLKEITDRSGIPAATAFRLVSVLTDWGALERGVDRRYTIGRRMWELGLLADVHSELRRIAAPFLQDLFVASREAVFMAVRQGRSALYLDRLAGVHSPTVFAKTGSRMPLHATGVGKVLLAHAPADVVERTVRDLRPFTRFTIVDGADLEMELDRVRRSGFARTREELHLGSASIAVPVVDSRGRVVASLGVVTADLRADLSLLLPALTEAARGIARRLPPR